ncbi:hypothetical protein BDR07DRAFT_272542 [Suillus spraguei]|nr:hypothetical protein BDR07DRAFT_272542 [Suillus spraguei]
MYWYVHPIDFRLVTSSSFIPLRCGLRPSHFSFLHYFPLHLCPSLPLFECIGFLTIVLISFSIPIISLGIIPWTNTRKKILAQMALQYLWRVRSTIDVKREIRSQRTWELYYKEDDRRLDYYRTKVQADN